MASLTSVIAANIRGRRAMAGWRQDELGERLGWTQKVISNIEQGRRELTLAELARVCRVFGVGLVQLVEGADDAEVAPLRLR